MITRSTSQLRRTAVERLTESLCREPRSAGSDGTSSTTATATVAANTAITAVPARQPSALLSCAAAGTPMTEAAETPPKTTAVASGTRAWVTSRGAIPAARAQKPPTPIPTSTRAASTVSMLGANADARLLSATSASRKASTTRLSKSLAYTATSGALTAATRPGTDTISPATPVETPRSALIADRTPTGKSSDVTSAKTAIPMVQTPSQVRAPSGEASSPDVSTAILSVPDRWLRAPATDSTGSSDPALPVWTYTPSGDPSGENVAVQISAGRRFASPSPGPGMAPGIRPRSQRATHQATPYGASA